MSKRLKYAKLRLAKPAADNPPSHGAGVEEVKTTGLLDVGACSRLIGKPSKYFSNDLEEPTASQQTFIEYASEPMMDNNEESSEPNTRRRTQEVPECNPLDGPKLPKLRKKACNRNVLISNFLEKNTVGDDDFEEAKSSTSSQTKPTKVQRAAKKLKAPKRPKNQGDIRKVFRKYKNDHEVLHKLLKEHSVSEQIDPEQLQMALAMSRSLVDYECGLNPVAGEEMQEQQLASSSSSIQERRIVGIRTTLEQFGFRCKNSYTDYDLNVIFGASGTKNVKKIKHNRATNLRRRDKEELSAFIDLQTKKLFPNDVIATSTDHCMSLHLENDQSYLSHLFWIAQTGLESEQILEKFYVPELLEMNPAPVGCLLKDWSKIPGRESTPEREERITCQADLETLTDVAVEEEEAFISASPDLFNECEQEDVEPIAKDRGHDMPESMQMVQVDDRISAEMSHNMRNETENVKENYWLKNTVNNGISNEALSNVVAPYDFQKPEDFRESNESSENQQCRMGNQMCKEDLQKSLQNVITSNKEHQISVGLCNEVDVNQKSLEHLEVILIDDTSDEEEKDNFFTAPDTCTNPEKILHRSLENIFDDTDPHPVIGFEVYSSDEEKISAPSQVTTESTSLNDNGSVHQIPIDLVLSEGLCNKAVQNEQCMSVAEQGDASATAKNSNCHIATVPSKDLSFNRIAIKARLTEALRGDSTMVETVSLVGDTESVKELDTSASNSNEVISSSPSKVNCTQPSDTQDDVLVISDDEINYSIRDVLPRDAPRDIACAKNGTENSLNNDLNITVPYYDGHTISQNESVVTNSTSSGSQAVMQSDCEVVTICSSESDMVSTVVEGADSTFAYLDNLVKQFNLPPLRAQLSASKCHSPPKQLEAVLNLSSQTRTIQYATDAENVLTDEQQSPDSTAKAHAKNTKQGNVISENLDNYLNYYEEPNFEEHEIEAESQACERPEKDSCLTSILASSAKPFSRAKSSTQLDSPTNCVTLKRIASESSIGCSSTPQDKELASDKRQKGDEFVDKFNDLKAAVPVIAPPEYVINTSIVKTDAPAYTAMSASEIDRELYKFGLKALTRSKAIRVLNYLFEQMHPYVDILEDTAEDPKLSVDSQKASAKGHKHISSVSTNIGHEKPAKCAFKLNVNEAEYFLPSKPRKKIHWCAVPLHISFFNLASESENLQRQILRYEPVNLDDIYKNLKNAGLRYETNDLIAFLDKHCITFRTVSGSGDRVAKTASKNGSK